MEKWTDERLAAYESYLEQDQKKYNETFKKMFETKREVYRLEKSLEGYKKSMDGLEDRIAEQYKLRGKEYKTIIQREIEELHENE